MEAHTSPAIDLLGLSKTYQIGGLAVSDGTTAVIRPFNLASSDDGQSISKPDEEKQA